MRAKETQKKASEVDEESGRLLEQLGDSEKEGNAGEKK